MKSEGEGQEREIEDSIDDMFEHLGQEVKVSGGEYFGPRDNKQEGIVEEEDEAEGRRATSSMLTRKRRLELTMHFIMLDVHVVLLCSR